VGHKRSQRLGKWNQEMTKPLITTNPVTSVAAYAARLSIASAVLFALLVGTLHLLEPEFNRPWHFISEYELGGFGWMMRLAFLALASHEPGKRCWGDLFTGPHRCGIHWPRRSRYRCDRYPNRSHFCN